MNNILKIILIIIVLNFLFKNNKVEKFVTSSDENERCKVFDGTCEYEGQGCCEYEGCYWDDSDDNPSKHICRELKCEDYNFERYRKYDDYRCTGERSDCERAIKKLHNDIKKDCNINCF